MVWTRPGLPKQITVHVGRVGQLAPFQHGRIPQGLLATKPGRLRALKLYMVDVNRDFMAKAQALEASRSWAQSLVSRTSS